MILGAFLDVLRLTDVILSAMQPTPPILNDHFSWIFGGSLSGTLLLRFFRILVVLSLPVRARHPSLPHGAVVRPMARPSLNFSCGSVELQGNQMEFVYVIW